MSFAEVIKGVRLDLGLSQDEFADRLNAFSAKHEGLFPYGFNKASISKWETGKAEPRMDTVRLIARTFGISPNELLELEPVSFSPDTQRIAAHIDDNVTEEQLNDILQYIDFIKSKK